MSGECVISELKDKFRGHNMDICLRKVPSYLSCFLNEDRDVIFIYKEVVLRSKVIQSNISDVVSDTYDADITGQPLEAPYCEYDTINFSNTFEVEPKEADSHYPISLILARSILSYCNISIKPSVPVWILTDACDLQKTILLSCEIKDSWITRSWVMHKGNMATPTIENLQANHSQFSKSPRHLATSSASCSYEIHREYLSDDPTLIHSLITLHASWNSMNLEPPLRYRSTQIKLNAKVRIGHKDGGLGFLWKQICLINDYLTLLATIEAENCGVPMKDLPPGLDVLASLDREQCHEPPLSRIRSTLMEPVKGVSNSNDTTLDSLVKQYSLENKVCSDITDRFWLLFIECKTYQELSACLNGLFIEIKRQDGPPPFLSTSNISRIGRVLLGDGGFSIPNPIEYLVEIGIEKLKKEMLLIFSKAQIATSNTLNLPKFPNFSEIPSTDWLPTARKWHLWLCQVFTSLEILCHIQRTLRLPNTTLYYTASNVLQYFIGKDSKIDSFESLIENPVQDIELPIPNENIERNLSAVPVKEWVFSLTTTVKFHKYRSIFYRTSQNPFPMIEKTLDEDDGLKLNSGVDDWYLFRSVSELFS